MAYIDVVLAAEDEVTPWFRAEHIGGQGHFGGTLHIAIQGARTTASSDQIDIALESCMVNEDGTLFQMHNGTELVDAWHRIDSDYIDLTPSRDTHLRLSHSQAYGAAFRLRYNSNSTSPVRVVVVTPFRSED